MLEKGLHKQEKFSLKDTKEDGIFTNSELNPKLIKKYCKLTPDVNIMLKNALKMFNLSARGYDRNFKNFKDNS